MEVEKHQENPKSVQPHSFREGGLVVVQSSLAAGLFGLVASLALLAGYYYLIVVYELGSPGKGLTATPWAEAVLPFVLPVMFIGSACFFFLYMFRKRTTAFDVRGQTVVISKRSLLGISSKPEIYQWNKVKSVLIGRVQGYRGVVYYEVCLTVPGLETKVFVKRFNTEGGAAVLGSEIASLIGVPEKRPAVE